MDWLKEKEKLNTLLNIEGKTYEEVGRLYGFTGAAIKKACKRIGVNVPPRRRINASETFNKGAGKQKMCLNCGNEIIPYGTNRKFCSHECQKEYQFKEYIKRWKDGEEDGLSGEYSLSKHIRRYFFQKYDNKCQICGWGEVNRTTNMIPLQIHHIDGNCKNNKEENLQLLCPNCHSLTDNFGSRNKNATIGRNEYFKKNRKK